MVRDMLIAYFFGSSSITDAYLSSFLIANMFILFMVTGMKDAFIPSYAQAIVENRPGAHLTNIIKGNIIIGLILSVIGIVLSPIILPLIYPNFHGEAIKVADWTSMIYYGSIVFVGINAVLEGYLDSENRFSISTFSQTIVVLSVIAGTIIFAKPVGIYAAAIGYLFGTIVSLLFKVIGFVPRTLFIRKNKIDWSEVIDFWKVFLPIGLTVAMGQVTLLIDSIFANHLGSGVMSYLNYAFRVVQFPQQIFAVTVATVVYPLLARAISKNDTDLFKKGIQDGLKLVSFILIPALIGMMYLMPNIIELLYQHGKFTHQSTIYTSQAAVFYLGQIFFFSLHMVITKAFYALKKGHLLLMVSISTIFLKIAFNFIFTPIVGYKGLALSSSLMALVYVSLCFVILHKMIDGFPLKGVIKEFVKICCASAVMYGGIALIGNLLKSMTSNLEFLIIIIIIGAILYIIFSLLFRVELMSYYLKRQVKKLH